MISSDILSLMRCPSCHGPELILSATRRPALTCTSCEQAYPIVDGIPDLVPPEDTPSPGTYRTETTSNLVAGVYDLLAPAMTLGVWGCSPLRYVDSENRALGRANHGVYLRVPMGTGLILKRALAPYHDMLILGMDRSWQMLRRAQEAMHGTGARMQLMRVDFERLPLKDGVGNSLHSLNGLHLFPDRIRTLREFTRCLSDDGFLSGATLIRGQGMIADTMLDRYERRGAFPMLRTAEFLRQDLHNAELCDTRFQTHGAVMFFECDLKLRAEAQAS